MQHAIGGKALAQAADQLIGEAPLGGTDRVGIPLTGLEIIDGHEGRLAAHSEAHVLLIELFIDLFA